MKWYRLLLRLYPASFRDEYGEEMSEIFLDRRRDARSVLAFAALWVDVLYDTLINSFRVHVEILRQDLLYARRTLGRSPGFALTVVLVTALGIGANAAVFSITDHVLLRPLPYKDSERLVKLWERLPSYGRIELSPLNFRDWRRMSTVFEGMAAFHDQSMNFVGQGDPRRLEACFLTTDLFPLLGVEPFLGRIFNVEDERSGAPGTILLSHDLWQSTFGGDVSVLGSTVRLDQRSYTVLGVMPRGFVFPSRNTEVWLPKQFAEADYEDRDNNYLQVVAKLKRGVSLEEARAEMDVITSDLERAYPVENRDTGATVRLLRDEVSNNARLLLGALFGASLCVLLIASGNLVNLLLTRGLSRERELAVRSALGSGRERLVRQLLTESLLLALAGGVLGLVLATAAVPLLSKLVPTSLPIGEATALDVRVLAFAAFLIGATGIGFGVLPALRGGGRFDLSVLRQGGNAGAGGGQRLRSALVMAEVTATVALLILSGLLLQALGNLRAVDPGFQTEGVLAVQTPLPSSKYESVERRAQLYSRVLSEVRGLPAVSEAAFVSFLPMAMRGGVWPVTITGLPQDVEGSEWASLRFVTSGFFSTLGIPLRIGRDVSESDTRESPFVAVVSESFVRRYWPEQDPLGLTFDFAFQKRTVVGVVGDVRVRGLEASSEPQVYLPYQQVPDGGLSFYVPKELVVRTASGVDVIIPEIRRIVRAADPELPISDVRTLEDVITAETAPRSTQLQVLGLFVAISLLLAAVGIYGLLSFSVSRRSSEIGLRVALGATPGDILHMVLGEGVLLATVGAGLGGLLGYAAGASMTALLAGVPPSDATTYLIAVAFAVVMTLAGCLPPAVRALRLDPTKALRTE